MPSISGVLQAGQFRVPVLVTVTDLGTLVEMRLVELALSVSA